MSRTRSKPKRWKIGTIGAIASMVAIPLAIVLWYASRSSTDLAPSSSTTMSSKGNNSPVVDAGRDAVIGDTEKSHPEGYDRATSESKTITPKLRPRADTEKMSTTGDNSPVVKAGRDAIINLTESKADYVTDHDGAGALLMTEPDFRAFVSSSINAAGEKVVGRLVNGTEVAKIELKAAGASEPNPPWAKIKVLEGELKDSIGWILMNSLRKP